MNPIVKLSRIQARQLSYSPVGLNVCWPKQNYGPLEVQRSMLLNGMKVVAAKPLGATVAACSIMFQAGSRYELDDQLGATHFIRACSTASGCGYSSYHKMRILQQLGAAITCSSDRQTLAFTMRCPLVNFPYLKGHLLDTAARCCFNEWEIDDRRHIVREDLERIHPQQRVLDMIQTASWTGPLANSVFCQEDRIDDMDENSLNCFANTHYNIDDLTVASVGIPFEETMKLAELLESRREVPETRYTTQSNPRAGFELYDNGRGSETWIAVAVPSCGTRDLCGLLKHGIIAAACGTHDMASGQHYMDRTAMNPVGAMAGNDVYTHYRAFNISYRDAGLFGILARTRASTAWHVALAASEFLTNVGDLNFKQIEIGKARLKLNLAKHEEDCVLAAEGLALQVANDVQVDSARAAADIIDQIPTDEICCAAKALSCRSSLMSMAVVGDIAAVPHDLELMCPRCT